MDPTFRNLNEASDASAVDDRLEKNTELEPKADWDVDGPSAIANGSTHGFQGPGGPKASPQPVKADGSRQELTPSMRPPGLDKGPMDVNSNRSSFRQNNEPKLGNDPMVMGILLDSWDDGGEWPENKVTEPAFHSIPHPQLSLPVPALTYDFRMCVALNPRISVGPTPSGDRKWISFTGGSWSASFGSGIVLPGGQDNQVVTPDGSARLETNYLLQTHDVPPAYIIIKTEGWRTGSPEVMKALADPSQADYIDPRSYSFRLYVNMETGDERYRDKINYGMWVGSGMRKGSEVIYDAFRIS